MPKYINSDDFLIQMQMLYKAAGWEKRDVHFSLADLECNIAMMPSILIPGAFNCQYCKWYHEKEDDSELDDHYCDTWGTTTGMDDFCSYWRKKENAEN